MNELVKESRYVPSVYLFYLCEEFSDSVNLINVYWSIDEVMEEHGYLSELGWEAMTIVDNTDWED